MEKFKPLLAATATEEDIAALLRRRAFFMLSPKLDGVRVVVRDGVAYARSLKPIRNTFVQEWAKDLDGLDGEIVVGEPTAADCYRRTVSGVMSYKGEPDFTFWAFDSIGTEIIDAPFARRYAELHWAVADNERVQRLPHEIVHSLQELWVLEGEYLEAGYEGAIVRDPEGEYKYGRSTNRQGIMFKVKRHADEEARVLDFKELQHNDNELETNELGYAKRSGHAENMQGMGTLGALVVEAPHAWEDTFNIGTGFTAAQRQEIWDNREHYRGRLAKFKHMPIGAKDRPRFPVFLGWRDEDDTGE